MIPEEENNKIIDAEVVDETPLPAEEATKESPLPAEEAAPAANPMDEVDEDGFTDELPQPEPAPAEEEASEEAAPSAEVEDENVENLAPEEAEQSEPEQQEELPYTSAYDDPRLQNIEDARALWNKSYRKMSRIRMIVSIAVLLSILAGWLIPSLTMKDAGSTPLIISLVCAGVAIAVLIVFTVIQRRHDKAGIQQYFQTYFENVNDYALADLGAENLAGKAEDKISQEEFLEGGAFDKVSSIGSRDSIVFTYKGMDCAMAEAAAQIDAGKSLQTIFVGKYLRTHNNVSVSNDGLLLYFKGNDRALPPAKIKSLRCIAKTHAYKVYGSTVDRRVLTPKVLECLAKIRTNKLLVDLTIVIKPGRTYFYLGYEDDIMVLPNDKPFEPRFTKQFKDEIAIILDCALALENPRG